MRRYLTTARWVGLAAGAGIAMTLVMGRAVEAATAMDLHGQAMAGGKPVANVVIWLDAPDAPRSPQRGRVVIDQRNLTFYPHVLAIRVGTTVDFPNHDRVFHNVFSYRDGKRFDLGLYPVGKVRQVTFSKPGLSRLFCNIHPEMSAYVMSVDTPYFAVSDRDGRFTLPEVPAGTFTYHAWRPGGSELKASTVVHPGTSLKIQWP